jgi:hypothetical protein
MTEEGTGGLKKYLPHLIMALVALALMGFVIWQMLNKYLAGAE